MSIYQSSIVWRNIIELFYKDKQIGQESYECLNAFLNVPEIMEIQKKKYLEEDEYEKYKETICRLVDQQKKLDKIRKYRAENNFSGRKLAKLYGADEEKYIAGFMERLVMYLILREMCSDIGCELFSIQENQVKYERYSNYRYSELGAHTPSPVSDLITGNEKRGTFYKRNPRKRNQVYRFKYRENGNLISAFPYLEEKPRYFCSILYSKNYIFYLNYCIIGSVEADINFLSYIDIIKYENGKPEYYEKISCLPNEPISDIKKERYLYKDNYINMWWSEKYCFPQDKCELQDGALERTLYIPEYDAEGLLYQYTVGQYIGDKLRDGKVENWKFGMLSKRIYSVQQEKRLDTGKDSLRWKYPPNYFDTIGK